MPLYFCKGPSTVMGVHGDDQLPALQARTLQPAALYGINTYVVVDIGGPLPQMQVDANAPPPPPPDPNMPPQPPPFTSFAFPTITDPIRANSIKLECRMRILAKCSEQSQRNMTARISEIQTDRMTQAPARPATPEEQSDIDTINAIFAWIGRPDGMQTASDAMITAKDNEWYQDVKWPPWNSAWDAFVVNF